MGMANHPNALNLEIRVKLYIVEKFAGEQWTPLHFWLGSLQGCYVNRSGIYYRARRVRSREDAAYLVSLVPSQHAVNPDNPKFEWIDQSPRPEIRGMRCDGYLVEGQYTTGLWFSIEVFNDEGAAQEFAQHIRDTEPWVSNEHTGEAHARVRPVPLTLSGENRI